ncbi:hypothetical protein [Corynebacterium heidelbergense]|uniref:Uncharacterized protein n=1 Tax=Corynebacterium heidelbergense TaxID=2055947 RepID=A0A364V9A3_9CORY|nr:hypothetical protein [Corynebacterium heidelbergense]RAV33209.1 hypothetical protein CWC39_09690 [Corynebacterium heidelbergense]WCZ36992.1 hypothetical protein CHEID_07295 [Corynebacterium heidelbergense]
MTTTTRLTIAATIIAFALAAGNLAILCYIATHQPTTPTPPLARPITQDSLAVRKPYAIPVDLPTGNTVTCIFNNTGGFTCDWANQRPTRK